MPVSSSSYSNSSRDRSGLSRSGPGRGTPAAGTCTDTSCRSALECCRCRSSTPSRPRHDCPRSSSGRRGVPSESGRARSTRPEQSTIAACRHKFLPDHPRPTGMSVSGLVMREIVPRISVLTVVLADRPPLPLAEIGSPFLPRKSGLARFVQPLLFLTSMIFCSGMVHAPFRCLRFFNKPARPVTCPIRG